MCEICKEIEEIDEEIDEYVDGEDIEHFIDLVVDKSNLEKQREKMYPEWFKVVHISNSEHFFSKETIKQSHEKWLKFIITRAGKNLCPRNFK